MNTEKFKVYLDTNMIHDFFVNQAVYVKRGEEPRIPKKISAHSMMQSDVALVWEKFLQASECEYISRAEFDERLVEIVSKMQMKLRTMTEKGDN